MMKYFTKEVKIGIAGLVALFMLIYGINYLKGINMFKPSSYYYVRYSNINGSPNQAQFLPTVSV